LAGFPLDESFRLVWLGEGKAFCGGGIDDEVCASIFVLGKFAEINFHLICHVHLGESGGAPFSTAFG